MGNFAALFKTTNILLVEVLKPDSEVLARIQQEFHTMLRARADAGMPAIKITCFFEELPVHGAGEVATQFT
jgi:protein SERAC1